MYHAMITKLIQREGMSSEEMSALFDEVLESKLEDVRLAAIFTALQTKGVTSEELFGLAKTVLKHSIAFYLPDRLKTKSCMLLDVCGTGGDKSGTFNVSTLTAVMCAAQGVSVVKHGNRAATSKCGSFDLLEAAGIFSLGDTQEKARMSLKENNIAFLFAPHYHPALKGISPIRKALGFPTVFNIIGPLVNPARPIRQMIGVSRPELPALMGQVAIKLGLEKVVFVHGYDGLDEVSVTGPTRVYEYTHEERVKEYTITPEDLGLGVYQKENLLGGGIDKNLEIAESIFGNQGSDAQNDFVLANSGVALYTAGLSSSIADGVGIAREVLENGSAGALWERLKKISITE